MIPIHRLDLGITQVYLLPCTDGYLLIDTGYASGYERFRDALKLAGVGPRQIRYLLLTHHHDDHVGFAARLRTDYGIRLIAHELAAAPLLRGASDDHGLEPFNWRVKLVFGLFQRFMHREFSYPPVALTAADFTISGDDAQLLRSLGIPGEILHTPGHSYDSISVLLEDGRAFCGDAAMNFLHFTGIHHRPIYQMDRPAVAASWRKLLEHGAREIYPAHGGPFPAAALGYAYTN